MSTFTTRSEERKKCASAAYEKIKKSEIFKYKSNVAISQSTSSLG